MRKASSCWCEMCGFLVRRDVWNSTDVCYHASTHRLCSTVQWVSNRSWLSYSTSSQWSFPRTSRLSSQQQESVSWTHYPCDLATPRLCAHTKYTLTSETGQHRDFRFAFKCISNAFISLSKNATQENGPNSTSHLHVWQHFKSEISSE